LPRLLDSCTQEGPSNNLLLVLLQRAFVSPLSKSIDVGLRSFAAAQARSAPVISASSQAWWRRRCRLASQAARVQSIRSRRTVTGDPDPDSPGGSRCTAVISTSRSPTVTVAPENHVRRRRLSSTRACTLPGHSPASARTTARGTDRTYLAISSTISTRTIIARINTSSFQKSSQLRRLPRAATTLIGSRPAWVRTTPGS
jgi:hypothetical protein